MGFLSKRTTATHSLPTSVSSASINQANRILHACETPNFVPVVSFASSPGATDRGDCQAVSEKNSHGPSEGVRGPPAPLRKEKIFEQKSLSSFRPSRCRGSAGRHCRSVSCIGVCRMQMGSPPHLLTCRLQDGDKRQKKAKCFRAVSVFVIVPLVPLRAPCVPRTSMEPA